MEMGGWAVHRGRVGFVQGISVVDIRSLNASHVIRGSRIGENLTVRCAINIMCHEYIVVGRRIALPHFRLLACNCSEMMDFK